tara:strand:+ start:3220 stop:3831 length:612 start_codon:yes stop_codon:yes gene_type:complete
MATPTYEELLKGATTWRFDHKGVSFILSHHGYRTGEEYEHSEPHPGIWCYYLLIPEQMYPHRWDDFACTLGEPSGTFGRFYRHGPAFDHDMFDTEITWASSEPYFDRKTDRMWDGAKVGCDYNHLWQHEYGYPDTFASVKRDAEQTVEKFLAAHPDRRLRSSYSGTWGEPDDFYTAKNGATVLYSEKEKATDGKPGSLWSEAA